MSDFVDVLIVGAGLSGIGAARHLQDHCPEKSYAILEGRDAVGGTWDLFRYPGVRSDSDMYTLGYEFKPWCHPKAIADGQDIRNYVQDAAREGGVDRCIRLNHKVMNAEWDSSTARWTVQVLQTKTGQNISISCRFLMMCSGYYNYAQGYTPEFVGRDLFKGPVIHPQFWPENLDYTGKRVVVIGSGATAVTLVPSMAERAQNVTMLQRSPTYIMAVPSDDPMAKGLRKILPEPWVYSIIRGRNLFLGSTIFKLCRRYPNAMRNFILGQVKKQLGKEADLTHFSPSYNPWDQRLCMVPDGDLFQAIKKGKASVVTDHIESFTEQGIKLRSGKQLCTDIIVTATGLNLQLFGGMTIKVDGKAFDMTEHYNYKGMMFNDLPNFFWTVGYTNASWTLKADLIAKYMCRLIKHLESTGNSVCMPKQKSTKLEEAPFMDMTSGYFKRAEGSIMPKGCSQAPWRLFNDYAKDKEQLLYGPVTDEVMAFFNPTTLHTTDHPTMVPQFT